MLLTLPVYPWQCAEGYSDYDRQKPKHYYGCTRQRVVRKVWRPVSRLDECAGTGVHCRHLSHRAGERQGEAERLLE